MKIATYNVNSINARIEGFCSWLDSARPDIVLLQEIKCEFNAFPFFEIQAAGYNVKILGQKSYNGVAVLSRGEITVTQENLPDFADDNARYLETLVQVDGQKVRTAAIYLPNGNPPYNDAADTSKFDYKLRWMDAFARHAERLVHSPEPVVLGGDFNIIKTDKDVYNPELFRGNALFRPEVVRRLQAIEYQGWSDAFLQSRVSNGGLSEQGDNGYTYWDYAGGAFAADLGLRIDYLFLSPKAADRLLNCWVDKTPRRGAKPSDHTALVAELKLD